ncbi:hypothetical protein G4G27_17765 [Sphingomonas sp. So64.6b]|uniref:hypothetical protein n=1 Tax=Sphingomonas sp. So64.6b TaxID=2997354 RepID=UPI0016028FE3|nr:hypothetical protein [Sphingomonas sp. So64.6b]QNA85625.1 hypothetical protein G4G27_17765 [Sphingomonas sp. So64.6b]
MRVLHVTLLLAPILLLGALAPPGATTKRADRASQCGATETIVYSCRFRRAVGSVCASKNAIHYRYGPPNRPAIDLVTDRKWSNIRLGTITGGGGGQESIRFTAGRYHYIVFKGVGGQYTDVPGKTWSGIHVSRDGKQVSTQQCPGTATIAGDWTAPIYAAAPESVRGTLDDGDARFQMWF